MSFDQPAAGEEPPLLGPPASAGWLPRLWRGDMPWAAAIWVCILIDCVLGGILLVLLQFGERIDLRWAAAMILAACPLAAAMAGLQSSLLGRSARRDRGRWRAAVWPLVSFVALDLFILGWGRSFLLDQWQILRGDPQWLPFEAIALYPDRLVLRGNLQAGCHVAFERALAGAPNTKEIDINSGGGRLGEGARIAADIRRQGGLATAVQVHCESAATLIFLAGSPRLAGGRLGFHDGRAIGLASVSDTVLSFQQRRIYEEDNAPSQFIDRMLRTPYNSIWYPSDAELLEAGVVTSVGFYQGSAGPEAGSQVMILPTDTFSAQLAEALARAVSLDLPLKVGVLFPPISTQSWPNAEQGVPDEPATLLARALPTVMAHRTGYGAKTWIILTTFRLKGFDYHDLADHISLVSNAGVLAGRSRIAGTSQRMRKLLLRAIEVQYYQFAASSDSRSLLYSPLTSVYQLDRMRVERIVPMR